MARRCSANRGWNWWKLVFSIRIVVIAGCRSTDDHGAIDPHYLEFKKGAGDCIPPQRVSLRGKKSCLANEPGNKSDHFDCFGNCIDIFADFVGTRLLVRLDYQFHHWIKKCLRIGLWCMRILV